MNRNHQRLNTSGRVIDAARLAKIKTQWEAEHCDLAKDGGWWCISCQHLTELDVTGQQSKCAICGSIRVKFMEPVKPVARIPLAVAKEFFADLKAACD